MVGRRHVPVHRGRAGRDRRPAPAQRAGGAALRWRSASRPGPSSTASFAEDFVADLAGREQAQAERLLGAPEVDAAAFEEVVASFAFEAAVLLDADGRLIHVYPARADLVGQDMTEEYEHLRVAVDGGIGVSQVVPSAAERVRVVAVAVPFNTPSGPRVFSGAFTPAGTPLESYLDSIVPVTGGSAVLVDDSGNDLTARTERARAVGPDIGELPAGVSNLKIDGGVTVAVAPVPDLPWRVALMAPSDGLYAPVAPSWTDWALWVALAGCGGLAALLVVRLGRARHAATEAANTDALTGLPNRRAMQIVLHRAAAAVRHGSSLAVLDDRHRPLQDDQRHARPRRRR